MDAGNDQKKYRGNESKLNRYGSFALTPEIKDRGFTFPSHEPLPVQTLIRHDGRLPKPRPVYIESSALTVGDI